jgi:hypothetical protein
VVVSEAEAVTQEAEAVVVAVADVIVEHHALSVCL